MRSHVLLGLFAAACVPTTTTPSGTATPTATPTGTPTGTTPAAATPVEERFLQSLSARVDLLYVVQDTVGSEEAQRALVEEVPRTFDYLLGSGIDYHVGVVSTDAADPAEAGTLRQAAGLRWIDRDTASPLEAFGEMLEEVGADGAGPVQARGAAYLALEVERAGANAGFYRDDANLVVVSVGDGADATDPAIVDAATFDAWLPGLKADPELVDWTCLLASFAAGTDCEATADLVGGQVLDLGVAESFEAVGLAAASLHQSWPLSRIPVPGTIEVLVEDPSGPTLRFSEAVDWTFDPASNSVSFLEYVPTSGAEIVVRYVEAP